MPEDAKYVIERTEVVIRFFGAFSIEKIPIEAAIKDQVPKIKMINV